MINSKHPVQGHDLDMNARPSYDVVRDVDIWYGGAFGGRGFSEEKFGRHTGFPREPFRREAVDRDFALAHLSVGVWQPPTRNRSYEGERGMVHLHDDYIDNHRDIDAYGGIDNHRVSASYRDLRGYEDINDYHDNQVKEPDGYYDRYVPRKDYASDDYECEYEYDDIDPRVHSHSREESHGLEHDYFKHSNHDSDYEHQRHTRKSRNHRHRERGRQKRGRSRECNRTSDRDRSREHHKNSDRGTSREYCRSSEHSRSKERGRSSDCRKSMERDTSCDRGRSRERDRSCDRGRSRERDRSSERERCRERSRSYSYDEWDRRSHSPWKWGSSYDDDDAELRRDRDGRRPYGRDTATPTATLVVKGLSQKTVDDDLYRALDEWGPLSHVRVIKERSSGASRGFAFVDFPSVNAAKTVMDAVGDDGLILDGRRLFLEYSSKPTGSCSQSTSLPAGNAMDWICTMCGCVNFARRTSCFQCNEVRTEDAPPADIPITASASFGRKASDSGPTHVLVVRGLDDHVNEEMLHYEFSKHAPLKDLRLVRDKFTRASRGFAFVHFHSVEDATKALEATDGISLEKNGQRLRVAYAKNIHGSGSSSTNPNSLAAAAIEAAAFSQQYGAAVQVAQNGLKKSGGGGSSGRANAAPQSGFVWDEASGYYYDAASGFYYDGHRGLYYDGNYGVWYTYNAETQQYVPYNMGTATENTADTASNGVLSNENAGDTSNEGRSTLENEKKPSLAEAVEAAAIAAQAAAKKDKEKMKAKEREIRLASKGVLLAHKKRLNDAVNLWKQRQQEGQRETMPNSGGVEKQEITTGGSLSLMLSHASAMEASEVASIKDGYSRSLAASGAGEHCLSPECTPSMRSIASTANMGVVENREATEESARCDTSSTTHLTSDVKSAGAPFKTPASALGSCVAAPGTKRRFTESPQPVYRDRAAERRNLYGSSSSYDEIHPDIDVREKGFGLRNRDLDMPFPPGVGPKGSMPVVGSTMAGSEVQPFEVITADKAIDEKNVGNRMLRNMGWQEGLGLGKDGSGIVEPVQALVTEDRAGLGSQRHKVDPRFETQPGDSYRVALQKKALQRFHEMV